MNAAARCRSGSRRSEGMTGPWTWFSFASRDANEAGAVSPEDSLWHGSTRSVQRRLEEMWFRRGLGGNKLVRCGFRRTNILSLLDGAIIWTLGWGTPGGPAGPQGGPERRWGRASQRFGGHRHRNISWLSPETVTCRMKGWKQAGRRVIGISVSANWLLCLL